MKYSKMIRFLNDNGILLMQAVIANEVDNQIPIGCNMSEDEYEQICEAVYQTHLENALDPDIDVWYLVDEELTRRGYKEQL